MVLCLSLLDDLLTGTSRVMYLLKNGTSTLPTEILSNGKLYLIGRVFQLLDVIQDLNFFVSFPTISLSSS